MNGMPKSNRLWCISCGSVAEIGAKTTVMKTAYKLTAAGPIPYGLCDKCNSLTPPQRQ